MNKKPAPPTASLTWFRNAAPYINAHRGRVFVLAFGGEAVADATFPSLVHDIGMLHALGVRLVLVHGARPQVESRLKTRGAELRYVNGLRVTDGAALEAVKEAAGWLRVEIEALLSMGLANTPMSGARVRVSSGNYVIAKPLGVRGGVDYCHTGEVRRVDAEAIRRQLELGQVVLLSPLGYSPTGEVFNLTAEDVATAVAGALRADKLVFLTESGPLRDGRRRLIQQLKPDEASALADGERPIPDELRLHLKSAVSACRQQVGRVHLVDRRVDGALLLELYTRDGIGTLVTGEIYERLRRATIEDVGGVLELIKPLEQEGVLVRRSREQLELEIESFTVIERDGMIVGCAALFPFPDEAVAEVACMAVHADYRDGGRGDVLLSHLETQAWALGVRRLFVLTTHTAHWFRERGFVPGDLKALPLKRRELYNYQRNSRIFIKTLEAPKRRR